MYAYSSTVELVLASTLVWVLLLRMHTTTLEYAYYAYSSTMLGVW